MNKNSCFFINLMIHQDFILDKVLIKKNWSLEPSLKLLGALEPCLLWPGPRSPAFLGPEPWSPKPLWDPEIYLKLLC